MGNRVPDDEWYDMECELVHCDRQPGKLRILKESCGRRYLFAREKTEGRISSEFDLMLNQSLSICKECPQGKRYAKALAGSEKDQRDGRAARRAKRTGASLRGKKRRIRNAQEE